MKKRSTRKVTAMFGKEGESMVAEGKMNSIIGKGCKVTGTIDVQDGTLRIDGEFEGNVNCPGGTLVIGKDDIIPLIPGLYLPCQSAQPVIGHTPAGFIDIAFR